MTNLELTLRINIKEIIGEETFIEFLKDNKKDILKNKSLPEFQKKMLENYEKIYTNKHNIHTVKFNIKGSDLYKNGILRFEDSIQEEINIPYEKTEKENFWNSIFQELSIRIVVVNWEIHLQIWNFPKWSIDNIVATEIFGKDEYATYFNYLSITTFPLQYAMLWVPKKFLNIDTTNLDVYYSEKRSENWKKEAKILIKEESMYDQIMSYAADDTVDDEYIKIAQKFGWKYMKKLEEEQFTWSNTEEYDYFTDKHLWYVSKWKNKYLEIEILDYNKRLEKNYKNYASGYIKEEFMP